MKRALIVLALLAAATAPAAAAAAIPPFQVTCFDHLPDAAYHGTAGPDIFYGTPGDDVIYGSGGDDVLYGMGGRDRICGGAGNDTIYGGPGADLLKGDWDDDRIYGQGGSDGFLLGGDGNDLLVPGAGDPDFTATIEGGAGRDRIVIDAPGYNEIFGGPGRDTVDFRRSPLAMLLDLRFAAEFVDASGAALIGGKAFEVENVFGSAGDDTLGGDAGRNRLFGFGGDDTLFGRAGDDYLDAGDGMGDWMEGGLGTDTCLAGDGFIVGDECEIWE